MFDDTIVQYHHTDEFLEHSDLKKIQQRYIPANTGHSPNAVTKLGHRLRRWPNIETALGESPVFAGYYSTQYPPIYVCTPGSFELNRYVIASDISNSLDSNKRRSQDCLEQVPAGDLFLFFLAWRVFCPEGGFWASVTPFTQLSGGSDRVEFVLGFTDGDPESDELSDDSELQPVSSLAHTC